MSTTIKMPEFGATGLVKKETLRFDFDPNDLKMALEIRGYRLVWSRAAMCPCSPVNDQTQQTNPNCPICKGRGWLYFGPPAYKINESLIGVLTPLQRYVLEREPAALIKGTMSNLQLTQDMDTQVARWVRGTAQATVRPENKLGYYDRLIQLDSEIVFNEVLTAGAPDQPLAGRYPIISVNFLSGLSKRYGPADFELSAQGTICWIRGRAPTAGTRLTIHYQTFPVWIVIDHPHSTRGSLSKKKTKTPITPGGNPIDLPVQALVRYDFLPE